MKAKIAPLVDASGYVVGSDIFELMAMRGKVDGAELIMELPARRIRMYAGCELRISKKTVGRVLVITGHGARAHTRIFDLSDSAMFSLRNLWRNPRGGWERGGDCEGYVVMTKKGRWVRA